MAASRARLEALLARVQKRATEARSPSAAVAPMLEAVKGGASRSPAEASEAAAPASVRAPAGRSPQSAVAQNAGPRSLPHKSLPHKSIPHNSFPYNQVTDDDVEEYDDELIEIIDDAEVIPQAAAAARAIEPAAFGAAVDRRPAAPIRSEPVAARSARPVAEPLRAEAVAPRPVAASEVARARGTRRELRHTSFVELLEASLKLG